MTPIAASAPGKVVIAGEYAVLDGAPAIAMAVDRRATVSMRPGTASTHTLSTPGYVDGAWRFESAGGEIRWLDELPEPRSMHLMECVFAECAWSPTEATDVTIDSRALHDPESGEKLGFGSSAAVAVGLAAACRLSVGDGATVNAVDNAGARAHYRFQDNRGSGVDTATAISGGVIRFTREALPERLVWPGGLQYRLYWSGTPASTRARIERTPDTEQGNLRESASAVAAAWARGDPDEIIAELSRFTDALEEFDAATGTGVFAAGHAELRAAGQTIPGLVYKPCGAGGGDIGIAIADQEAALRSFDELAVASGFVALDASMDSLGVLATLEAA